MELLTVVAIIGLIAACVTPAWMSLRRRAAVRSAAHELRSIFQSARSRAVTRSANAGVKFTSNGSQWQYAIYDDGDGDGIRNDDIRNGIDTVVQSARFLSQQPQLVSIGLLDYAIRDPDGDPLPPTASPVQFNRSTICSFSRLGQSTPGTIYLTDEAGELFAVRMFGGSAKVRLLRYVPSIRKWEAR